MTTGNSSRADGDAAQAPPDGRELTGGGRTNINPATGLATDYLNHFNEAIMLLEMSASSSEAVVDFLAWEPRSYTAHFSASKFADRDAAIAAYDDADPRIRRQLDALADIMTVILMTAHAVLEIDPPQPTVDAVARRALAGLKPLVARAGVVINGSASADDEIFSPQDVVDYLMER